MRTLILALILLAQTGCATLLGYRDVIECYQPQPGRTADKADYDFCNANAKYASSHRYCMEIRGYQVAQCYADNGEAVKKAAK